ncbi:hypothetical protein HHI36_015465 [Cryptolaemus montrouzieri]|uniref:Uncharacterized protein n=1 Tax=Cryptolaemus montrouzieri TaxID=559131 RepID=A0ABD2N756_9CUCU
MKRRKKSTGGILGWREGVENTRRNCKSIERKKMGDLVLIEKRERKCEKNTSKIKQVVTAIEQREEIQDMNEYGSKVFQRSAKVRAEKKCGSESLGDSKRWKESAGGMFGKAEVGSQRTKGKKVSEIRVDSKRHRIAGRNSGDEYGSKVFQSGVGRKYEKKIDKKLCGRIKRRN